ncbi:aminopeptidase [Marivirga sp. S37H4]|uniref:Aminopeptidase N n=1 Tax=Marivirga aurantiaca TaxID=2802615 RepID=A0A935C6J2_9BACT|nr:M1 family aminopeptidase [Marivirga aurantiaca]MBK6264400.1 aminopeptidase [Marivirga aurantiaca]
MNRPFKSCCFIFLSFLFSCGLDSREENTLPIETGVSRNLADYRKKVISNLNYQLRFSIPASVNDPIEASEVISLHLKKNEQPLQIDFKEPTAQISQLKVNGRDIEIDHRKEHLIIPISALKEGENTIAIDFIAGDLSLNRNDDYLYTLLVPDRARTVFPVFDQPNLKATFDLTLTVPKDWQALANGALKDSLTVGEQTTYHFETSDKVSTYLFSFAAGKFEQVSKTINGVSMNFFHRETDEEKIRESIEPIFQIHADALKFLEEYTQIPYPFQKFDFIAIPGFQYGGMEHVGAIDYKSSTLFLDEGATKNQKIARSSLIAHETAHMWFGDLVTMEWFNDVWMKEVFANFMADKITEIALEGSNYDLKFLSSHFPAAYGVDRTRGANPIRQELTNLKDAGSLYGNIIYHKAPIMMRQLESLMGEELFREGLREYLKAYAYENATWPQLIDILDNSTEFDLKAWNQVWVNEPGRAVFEYTMEAEDEKMITITQHDPGGKERLWPQVFELLLVYPDHSEVLTVNMDMAEVKIELPDNFKLLDYILFNSSGQGYGVFPLDSNMLVQPGKLYQLEDPVQRAAAYINFYETMLIDRHIAPNELLITFLKGLKQEPEELNLNLMTSYLSEIYWKFIPEEKRNPRLLEEEIWEAMQQNPSANSQKVLFKTYQDIAMSQEARDRLYEIWKGQKPPENVKLSEEDYTSLALSLAVRDCREGILLSQLERIENPDRKKRLEFMMPALSSDVAVRDAFFNSLKDPKNRQKEAWVGAALHYLHHPLRKESSEKYLKESLELLEEIQQTGDIFFPYRWLQATFSAYSSDEALQTVNNFLNERPNYNPKLIDKILQATDDMYRANEIVGAEVLR